MKGDVPRRLMIEFTPEFTVPATKIYNVIIKTAHYPTQWKQEYQIPIPKVSAPISEDQVKNISLTSFLSRVLESILCDWLLPIVDPFLDPGQYGGLKGSSTNHYLVKLLDFIHKQVDNRLPHAVVLMILDLSKAFNRGSASYVLEDLFNMHVPGWLLAIIASYMSNRKM